MDDGRCGRRLKTRGSPLIQTTQFNSFGIRQVWCFFFSWFLILIILDSWWLFNLEKIQIETINRELWWWRMIFFFCERRKKVPCQIQIQIRCSFLCYWSLKKTFKDFRKTIYVCMVIAWLYCGKEGFFFFSFLSPLATRRTKKNFFVSVCLLLVSSSLRLLRLWDYETSTWRQTWRFTSPYLIQHNTIYIWWDGSNHRESLLLYLLPFFFLFFLFFFCFF